jgi:dephospho-CoA kinase
MPIVLGITGGIATGKSTVTRMLAELGAETSSADEVAREVLERGTAVFREVVERFGEGVLKPDGSIDRAELGRLVFADEQARRDLEAITHPRIISAINESIDKFRREHAGERRVLAVEIPLLYECGLEDTVDEVLVVAAEQEAQVGRLTTRSMVTREEALSRIRAQMSLDEKVERADFVVWNDDSIEVLSRRVRAVWEEIFLL